MQIKLQPQFEILSDCTFGYAHPCASSGIYGRHFWAGFCANFHMNFELMSYDFVVFPEPMSCTRRIDEIYYRRIGQTKAYMQTSFISTATKQTSHGTYASPYFRHSCRWIRDQSLKHSSLEVPLEKVEALFRSRVLLFPSVKTRDYMQSERVCERSARSKVAEATVPI